MQINPMDSYNTEPLTINEEKLRNVMGQGDYIIALVTATKPDFYKQWSLIPAAQKQNMPLFIMNTGQHHDNLVGHGLKELNMEDKIAVNMNIKGDLTQKTSELVAKVGYFAKYLKKHYPNKTVLPIAHGDTHAAGIVPLAWMFATNQKCAQNEAALRSMSPDFKNCKDIDTFIQDQFNKPWAINRNEPFPEQFDTFIGGAACHYHFTATRLNTDHLIREGYNRNNIYEVGNSVVDAVAFKRKEKPEESVFNLYPQLETGDDWIRTDIHRRANLLPERFMAIIEGITKLVKAGHNIIFINMNATDTALRNYRLKDKLLDLSKTHKNFVFTDLWQSYGHVIEFLESGKCFAEFTDSGSMQEELNEIQKPICLTARFNTDRPETVTDAKTNLLIPPIGGDYIKEFIEKVKKDEDLKKSMTHGKRLYGNDVGNKIIKAIKDTKDYPFEWAHDAVGIKYKKEKSFDFL